MKKILTFILSLVILFNINTTFSQNDDNDTILKIDNSYTVDTVMYNNYTWINFDDIEFNWNITLNFQQMINVGSGVTVILRIYGDLSELDNLVLINNNNDTINLEYGIIGGSEDYGVNLGSVYNNGGHSYKINVNELRFYNSGINLEPGDGEFEYRTGIDSLVLLCGPSGPQLAQTYTIVMDNENTLSIDNNEIKSVFEINVYPNPVVNYITVDFETELSDVPVELYSLNGKLLYIDNEYRYFGRNSVKMDMYDYPNGMYLIKIGEAVRKVVVE